MDTHDTIEHAETTTGYLALDDSQGGGRLYYETAGAGAALVFCHAGFVDSGMWDAQWETFARAAWRRDWQAIRYDMRGYGKSDPATGPLARRAELGTVLDHLGVQMGGAHAHLVGSSMSGEMALDFALEQPERVASLTLVSATPGGFELQGAPPADLLAMLAALEEGDLAGVADYQLRLWLDGPFRAADAVDAAVRAQVAAMNRIAVQNGTWATADAQPLAPLNPPAVQRLHELRVPVLIVTGALDHPEILRAGDVMAHAIPGARRVILPDSAHLPNMEQPAAFNRALEEFLKEVAV